MASIDQFIQQHDFLSRAERIWRHKSWVAGNVGRHWKLVSFFDQDVNMLDGGRWRAIDMNWKQSQSGWKADHLPFSFKDGILSYNTISWRPMGFGAYDDSYLEIDRFDIRVDGSRLSWSGGLFRYEFQLHTRGATEVLVVEELPEIDAPYIAIQYESDHLPPHPIAWDRLGNQCPCKIVHQGGYSYVMVEIDWLRQAEFPVSIDPDYRLFTHCYMSYGNTNDVESYGTIHGHDPGGCTRIATSIFAVQKAFRHPPDPSNPVEYSWQRTGVVADLTGVVDHAELATSTWQKFLQFTPTDKFDTRLYKVDFSDLYPNGCPEFDCGGNAATLNTRFRDSAVFDVIVMPYDYAILTDRETSDMDVDYINTAIDGTGFVTYAVKSKQDHAGIPPALEPFEGQRHDGGSYLLVKAPPNPLPYLTLEFESANPFIFGDIVG